MKISLDAQFTPQKLKDYDHSLNNNTSNMITSEGKKNLGWLRIMNQNMNSIHQQTLTKLRINVPNKVSQFVQKMFYVKQFIIVLI